MVDLQTLTGNWNQIRGQLKEKWDKLTEDDLQAFNGNVEQLVGRIQQKTGESREAVEQFLDRMTSQGSQILSGARDAIEQGASQSYDALRAGYAEAEGMVQRRPGQSLAVAFGLGMVSGLGLALLLRGRARETYWSHGRAVTEQMGRQMLDRLSSILSESLTKAGR